MGTSVDNGDSNGVGTQAGTAHLWGLSQGWGWRQATCRDRDGDEDSSGDSDGDMAPTGITLGLWIGSRMRMGHLWGQGQSGPVPSPV